MTDIQVFTQSEQALEYIISVAIPLIVGLLSLALALFGGEQVWKRVQALARQARPYVDEPTDPVNQAIEAAFKALKTRGMTAAVSAQILRTLVDLIAQTNTPAPEATPLAERGAAQETALGIPEVVV